MAGGRRVIRGVSPPEQEAAARAAQDALGAGFCGVRVDGLAAALAGTGTLAGVVCDAGVVLRGAFAELEGGGRRAR